MYQHKKEPKAFLVNKYIKYNFIFKCAKIMLVFILFKVWTTKDVKGRRETGMTMGTLSHTHSIQYWSR